MQSHYNRVLLKCMFLNVGLEIWSMLRWFIFSLSATYHPLFLQPTLNFPGGNIRIVANLSCKFPDASILMSSVCGFELILICTRSELYKLFYHFFTSHCMHSIIIGEDNSRGICCSSSQSHPDQRAHYYGANNRSSYCSTRCS